MKKLVFFLLFFSSTLFADTSIQSELQKTLDEAVAINKISGATLFLSSPHYGTLTLSSGYSDRIVKKAMLTDDNFRIASMSKTFLAVTVLKLAAENKLNLDERIAKFLPSTIEIKRIPNGDIVTIRQLLNMRSGIPNYTDYEAYLSKIGTDHDWKPEDVIPIIYDEAPSFAPDTAYEYSNTNYVLLQTIVESITGTSLSAQERKYIFDPLHLKNTYGEIQEKRTQGFYGLTTHGYDKIDNKITDVTTLNDGFGLGDGNIVSTLGDMSVFIRALLESKTLLSPRDLHQMLKIKEDYGLGIFKNYINNQLAWQHSGHSSGFSGEYFYFPHKKITLIVLTNDANSTFFENLAQKILSILNPSNSA